MFWFFTVVIAILILWSIYSSWVVIDDASLIIYCEDNIILRLSKIYWLIILISILGVFLFGVSFLISSGIWCSATNNDDNVCTIWGNNEQ
ncbi:MAG: hypothetical protein IIZ40_00660 [Bacilli bacterium]|nr:hypothetical protein [Bacilli bacterium]